jgi:hypothetical protein
MTTTQHGVTPAPGVPDENTLAIFAAWVEAQQAAALAGMNNTTGDAFGKHCDAFIELTAARNALLNFSRGEA